MNKWIKERLHIYVCIYIYIHTHTVESFPGLRKKEVLPFATTWMSLEVIMLLEISQTQKDIYCMIPLM